MTAGAFEWGDCSANVREDWIRKFGTSHGQHLETIALCRWHFEYKAGIRIQHAWSIHFRYYVIQQSAVIGDAPEGVPYIMHNRYISLAAATVAQQQQQQQEESRCF